MSTARRASATVMMPLSPTGSFVVFISHSTSAHVSPDWKSGSGPRGLGAISMASRGLKRSKTSRSRRLYFCTSTVSATAL